MTHSRRVRRRADICFGDAAALEAREREFSDRVRRATGNVSSPRLPDVELTWPLTGRITSRFGDRVGRVHGGIDIAATPGTPVLAVAAGRAVIAEPLPDFGNTIVVDHGDGFASVSAHLREMLVAVGDLVARGQVIGLVGATGRTTGPHLHFEARLGGTPCDPSGVLPAEGDPAEALRVQTLASLGDALAGVREVVLVGSTLHGNAGDSLIWLGQLSLLAELGVRVGAVVHPASFDRHPFDHAPPGAPVLLSGGGNFGDIWPFVQRHREWVLREITDRRIVQLPQSLHFSTEAASAGVRRSLAARDDVLLTWRDCESLRRAETLFPSTESRLVPDVAFARRPPRVATGPSDDILWIARGDREGGTLRDASARTTDWHLDPLASAARSALWFARRLERRVAWVTGPRLPLVLSDRAALMTAAAAANLVGSARVIVTDRLHAHVLCTMLAVPHVIVDDGYGKIDAFLSTWPVASGFAHRATSADEASALAHELLRTADADFAVPDR